MDATQISRKGAVGLVLSLFLAAEVVCAGVLYVDPNGTADYLTIAAAVEAAQTGDTIVLLPGIYGGAGNTNIRVEAKTLTIRGSDPNDPAIVADTLIDCSASGAEYNRAFAVDGTMSPAGLTLAGLSLARSTGTYEGGAVLCLAADLTLINCAVFGNEVAGSGAGLSVRDGRATLTGCSFRDNTSASSSGGAIFCRNSVLDVLNGVFERNSGSALQALDSTVTLTRCSFTDNTGAKGGAVYSHVARDLIPQTHLIVNAGAFVRNNADGSGGALYLENVPAIIAGSTFRANTAQGDGGALCNSWTSPAVSECLFVGNTAAGGGGAVFNWNQSSPQIAGCTFVTNQAGSGGAAAIQMGGEAFFSRCILWDNTLRKDASGRGNNLHVARYGNGTVTTARMTVQYCDIKGGQSAASIVVDAGCALNWGAGNKEVDPLFIGALQNDYHLSPESPCIDTGDPAFAAAAGETDLDGSPRVFGGVVDMGAYEYQGLGPVYRFWSLSQGAHFYTISGSERNKLINESASVWQYEGIGFYAYFRNTQANLAPVYRFWSTATGQHLYTISESEKNKIVTQLAKDWKYEGVVFYAYAPGKQPFGAIPVYRFAAVSFGDHFYTASESEKNKLLNQAHRWIYEGVAWYAFAHPNQLTPAAYEFAGGAKAASCAMTLAAYVDGARADLDQPTIAFTAERTRARMMIDFGNRQTTLGELQVRTPTVSRTLAVTRSGLSVAVPLTMKASFEGLCPRGPFGVDASTGLFADFRAKATTDAADAVQFDLSGSGSFGSLTLLPGGLDA